MGKDDAGALALKALSNSQNLIPGRYRVSIHVNQNFFDNREIEFAVNTQADDLAPCLSPELLNDIGVKLDGGNR